MLLTNRFPSDRHALHSFHPMHTVLFVHPAAPVSPEAEFLTVTQDIFAHSLGRGFNSIPKIARRLCDARFTRGWGGCPHAPTTDCQGKLTFISLKFSASRVYSSVTPVKVKGQERTARTVTYAT